MEKKMVIVPFEVELAKRIQNGEYEGKIVTRNGRSVRVVCWDYKSMSGSCPILALVCKDIQEVVFPFSEDGRYNIYGYNKEDNFDLVLEIPEYMTFKDGDVISFGNTEDSLSVGIFHEKRSEATHECYVIITKFEHLVFEANALTYNNARFATEEEKQRLIEALKESKEPKAIEYLKRFFGIAQKQGYEFKPFDKVLVRDDNEKCWMPDFFWDKGDMMFRTIGGTFWNQCIPYNDQTAHLLDTTDNWEE